MALPIAVLLWMLFLSRGSASRATVLFPLSPRPWLVSEKFVGLVHTNVTPCEGLQHREGRIHRGCGLLWRCGGRPFGRRAGAGGARVGSPAQADLAFAGAQGDVDLGFALADAPDHAHAAEARGARAADPP